jgi:hypothetical protein
MFGIYKKYKRYKISLREKTAPDMYQLKEFDGKLWVTYGGGLVCPCDMLAMDAVEAIRKMRELYIEREGV